MIFERGHRPVAAVETGWWTDSDDSDYPDAGEEMSYAIVVANEGTVTLLDVNVADTSGDVLCDETVPLAVLKVGSSFHCTASRQVRGADFIQRVGVYTFDRRLRDTTFPRGSAGVGLSRNSL